MPLFHIFIFHMYEARPDHNAAQLTLVHIFIFHMCTCRLARLVKVAMVNHKFKVYIFSRPGSSNLPLVLVLTLSQ